MVNASHTADAACTGCDSVSTSNFTPYWVTTEQSTASATADRMTAWEMRCSRT